MTFFINSFLEREVYLDIQNEKQSRFIDSALKRLGANTHYSFWEIVNLIITDKVSNVSNWTNTYYSLESAKQLYASRYSRKEGQHLPAIIDPPNIGAKKKIRVLSLRQALLQIDQLLNTPYSGRRNLESPFIKVDTTEGNYGPVFKEFLTEWPVMKVNGVGCPFGPKVRAAQFIVQNQKCSQEKQCNNGELGQKYGKTIEIQDIGGNVNDSTVVNLNTILKSSGKINDIRKNTIPVQADSNSQHNFKGIHSHNECHSTSLFAFATPNAQFSTVQHKALPLLSLDLENKCFLIMGCVSSIEIKEVQGMLLDNSEYVELIKILLQRKKELCIVLLPDIYKILPRNCKRDQTIAYEPNGNLLKYNLAEQLCLNIAEEEHCNYTEAESSEVKNFHETIARNMFQSVALNNISMCNQEYAKAGIIVLKLMPDLNLGEYNLELNMNSIEHYQCVLQNIQPFMFNYLNVFKSQRAEINEMMFKICNEVASIKEANRLSEPENMVKMISLLQLIFSGKLNFKMTFDPPLIEIIQTLLINRDVLRRNIIQSKSAGLICIERNIQSGMETKDKTQNKIFEKVNVIVEKVVERVNKKQMEEVFDTSGEKETIKKLCVYGFEKSEESHYFVSNETKIAGKNSSDLWIPPAYQHAGLSRKKIKYASDLQSVYTTNKIKMNNVKVNSVKARILQDKNKYMNMNKYMYKKKKPYCMMKFHDFQSPKMLQNGNILGEMLNPFPDIPGCGEICNCRCSSLAKHAQEFSHCSYFSESNHFKNLDEYIAEVNNSSELNFVLSDL